MKAFSDTFRDLWGNKERSLNIENYELCLAEFKGAHDKRVMIQWILAIFLFGVGLVALYSNAIFVAVVFLMFAGYCNLNSANHILVSEIMNTQRLLAMLINKQTSELEDIRRELAKAKINGAVVDTLS